MPDSFNTPSLFCDDKLAAHNITWQPSNTFAFKRGAADVMTVTHGWNYGTVSKAFPGVYSVIIPAMDVTATIPYVVQAFTFDPSQPLFTCVSPITSINWLIYTYAVGAVPILTDITQDTARIYVSIKGRRLKQQSINARLGAFGKSWDNMGVSGL